MLATGGLPFSLPKEILTDKVINLRPKEPDAQCTGCIHDVGEKCLGDVKYKCRDVFLNSEWEYRE